MTSPHRHVFLLLAIMLLPVVQAENPTAPTLPGDATDEVTIVFRVSEELIDDLTRDEVDMTVPVHRKVDDFLVTGTASGQGEISVQLNPSDERAEFTIAVTGTALGDLTSDLGPAVIRGKTRATYSSTKLVVFDGSQFHAEAAETENKNCTTIDGVCAKRRGPLGKVIEKCVRRLGEKSLGEINTAAEEIATEMLTQTFDESTVDFIGELNETTRFEELLDKYFPETASWEFHCATRPHFLVAGMGPPTASLPELLLDAQDIPSAHIELWVRLTPGQAALLDLLGTLDVTNDALRDMIDKEDADDLSDEVKVERRGDWSVILVGLPKEMNKQEESNTDGK